MNLNYSNFKKDIQDVGRSQDGMPNVKKNLTILQIYETTSPKRLGVEAERWWFWKWIKYVRLRQDKLTVCKTCTSVYKVCHKTMG